MGIILAGAAICAGGSEPGAVFCWLNAEIVVNNQRLIRLKVWRIVSIR